MTGINTNIDKILIKIVQSCIVNLHTLSHKRCLLADCTNIKLQLKS